MTSHRKCTGAAIGLLVFLAACSSSHPAGPQASAGTGAKPTTLVAIGGSATEGDGVPDRFRQAWPYVLFDNAFTQSTTFVNAALDGATVANAAVEQLPVAAEVKPNVVAIWLGPDDLAQRTPIDRFRAGLQALIEDLRRTGAARILVADLPLAYPGAGPYNAAIRGVAQSTKSTLVELVGSAVSLAPTDRLAPQPDAASHRVIAAAFARALKTAS